MKSRAPARVVAALVLGLSAGLTGFGLVPGRPKDLMGCGLAWGWLNTDPGAGAFFFPEVPGPNGTALSVSFSQLL